MFAFPLYDETLAISHVLMSYGFVLAHEIGHGFDIYGAAFGPFGVVENNSWPEETRRAFGVSSLRSVWRDLPTILSSVSFEEMAKGSNTRG